MGVTRNIYRMFQFFSDTKCAVKYLKAKSLNYCLHDCPCYFNTFQRHCIITIKLNCI